jgi:pyruvate-formate lyase-activating enzyme
MKIFGHEISLRKYTCSLFGAEPQPVVEPYLNLYVRFKGCNAHCSFCEFMNTASPFNEKKYQQVLHEVKSKIKINKISFTGGEPTLNFDQFKHIYQLTAQEVASAFVINTNGYQLKRIFEDDEIMKRIDSISLSRHHYNDQLNNEILGFEAPTIQQIKKLPQNHLFNLTCNLIKGYIDSKAEIYRYLEHAANLGIDYVGLVSLMPINDYCKQEYIDFESLDLVGERFKLMREQNFEDYCKCYNYLYIPENVNSVIRVYYKNTYRPHQMTTSLVFDGENLSVGFSGPKIF